MIKTFWLAKELATKALIGVFLASTAIGSAHAVERGGELTAALFLEPVSLDPLLGNAPPVDVQVLRLIYDTLVEFSREGDIVPGLAEAFEYSDDNKSLTFHIRDGVSFHDGTAVDAEAVAYNLQRINDSSVQSIYAAHFQQVASVEVVDAMTVRVNLNEPSSTFLASMASIPGMIASPTALKAKGEDYGVQPVGSGPFQFDSRRGGSSLSLDRNPSYWEMGEDGDALPYLDEITFRWILEPSVKEIELTSGNVQLVDRIEPGAFDQLEADPDITLFDVGGIEHWMALNISQPPFDDIRLRKALYFGMNRELIAQISAGNAWQITPTFVHPTEWIYDASIDPYGYDPDKARELLAEAGYGPDNPFEWKLSMIQREPDVSIAQIIQSQLIDVGMKVELELLERQSFIDTWRNNRHQAGMGASPSPHSNNIFFQFLDRSAPQRTGAGLDSVFDLVDKARVTVDREALRQTYIDIQREILDEAMYVWIFMRTEKQAHRDELQGFDLGYQSAWPLETVWLDQ